MSLLDPLVCVAKGEIRSGANNKKQNKRKSEIPMEERKGDLGFGFADEFSPPRELCRYHFLYSEYLRLLCFAQDKSVVLLRYSDASSPHQFVKTSPPNPETNFYECKI